MAEVKKPVLAIGAAVLLATSATLGVNKLNQTAPAPIPVAAVYCVANKTTAPVKFNGVQYAKGVACNPVVAVPHPKPRPKAAR